MEQVERYANRYLDYECISASVVGAPWHEFSVKQETGLIRAFKDMVTAMYLYSALTGVADVNMRLLLKTTANGNKFDVFSEIQTKEGTEYEVTYQPYQSGGVHKIYDIRVDSTSSVTVYRNQSGELIRSEDVDGIIATVVARGLRRR